MTEKRFTIKPQDDLFGVVDNYSADKVCVINGIRTEIEAEWLCNVMNTLNDENEQLKQQVNCHKSRIQLLSPLLDLADTIIDLSDDEKAKAFWEKRNNEVEQEWNEILKGDVE